MADISDAEVLVRENLKDSGCSGELAERVIQLIKCGHINEALRLLSDHRKTVLDNCRAEQKKSTAWTISFIGWKRPNYERSFHYGETEFNNRLG